VDLTMVPDEQTIYARWLEWGARLGLAVLIGSFLLYAFQGLEPFVPWEQLPQLWTLPVDRYLVQSGAPPGWGWVRLLGKGDYLNFLGVAILSLVTVVCYARVAGTLLARGERLQAGLAIVQVLILLAAASGWIAAGH
jgi:hypothetical protein